MANYYGIPDYILFTLGLFIVLYLYLTRKYGYWKKRGVPEVPPVFPIGSWGFNFNSSQAKQEEEWYKKYGKVFGIYEGTNPVLVVADLDLVKSILVKDFSSFPEQRRLRFGNEILDRIINAQKGERWKELRSMMSPTFTSGKLRGMETLMAECCQILVDNLIEAAKENKEVDITKYAGTFTIDVIARCAFGIKLNSRKDPNNPFVVAARRSISPLPWRIFVAILFPWLARLVRLSLFDPKTISFFKDVIQEVISKRKFLKDEEKPKDFLQLLLEAVEEQKDKPQKFDLHDVISQCVGFFIAGYIGTSATLSYSAHQLAISPNIQEKIIQEIDEAVKSSGKFDYDTVAGMKYLEAFVQEILRKYSPNIRIDRTSSENYKLGNTGIVIEEGTLVVIPTYALNHDPNYFPDPDKFDPERFLSDKNKIVPFTNMPFGGGPRICLGMRFAMMEIKMAIAKILQNVRLKPGINTKEEPVPCGGRGLNRPKDVLLKIEIRK